MFAHEVLHRVFEVAQDFPALPLQEEIECDRWAFRVLLDGAEGYTRQHSWNPATVRAKRLWGILITMMTILSVTPRASWGTGTHPGISERLVRLLDSASDPVPDWFWETFASILAAFIRKLGLIQAPIALSGGFRHFSYELVSLMQP